MIQISDLGFITNTETKDHLRQIKAQMEASTEVWMAVAFLKTSGLKLLEPTIKDAIAKGTRFRVICGLDMYITEPAAIRLLQDWFQDEEGHDLRLMPADGKKTFHPKVYCFHKPTGEVTLLVGSANLTRGGVKMNDEASLLVHTNQDSQIYDQVRAFFQDCIQEANPISEIDLSQYTRQFDIYRRHMKAADREFEEELKTIDPLQRERILSLADAYRNDQWQQNDFRVRSNNYQEAHQILLQMMHGPIESKEDFLQYYELLVGGKDQPSYWHSAGLARSKTMVAKNFKIVLQMLEELYEKIDQPVEEVFSTGLFFTKKVNGLSVNVLTEILNTLSPNCFAVLNKRPIAILDYFGFEDFPGQRAFKPTTYARFIDLLEEIRVLCHFEDLGWVDHFLNYIYDKNHDRL